MNAFLNADCFPFMRLYPDDFFDLAIVDPPYGAGIAEGGGCKGWFTKYHQNTGGGLEPLRRTVQPVQARHYTHGLRKSLKSYESRMREKKIITWDVAPGQEYFKELFRVSRNQIIWGGNYFDLPPTRCFLVWRKTTISENFSMAMCEYAWTSFNTNAKLFEHKPQGQKGDRFHPTQKPIPLYEWILNRYAKLGDKILDTHVGSASSLIACERLGFEYHGFEIDKTYYEKAVERMERYRQQGTQMEFKL